jgi:hypothetical protein
MKKHQKQSNENQTILYVLQVQNILTRIEICFNKKPKKGKTEIQAARWKCFS